MISKRILSKLLMFIVYIVCLLAAYFPFHATIASEADSVIDITSSLSNAALSAENMAPGDEISGTLEIINTGSRDFDYTIQTDIAKDMDEKLYNALSLTISEDGIVLYSGFLSEASEITAGKLNAMESSYLDFNVALPMSAGNDLQGLTAGYEIIVNAVSDSDPHDAPGSGAAGMLPQTGDQIPFMYYILGVILIIAGGLVYKSKRGSGKSTAGNPPEHIACPVQKK